MTTYHPAGQYPAGQYPAGQYPTAYAPPVPATPAVAAPARTRNWAFAGVAAGVTGALGIVASLQFGAIYEEGASANAAETVQKMADDRPWLIVFHVATMACVALLLVFAAGLKRRLEEQAPVGSLLPTVASSGLLLTAVAGLMGAGLDTEFLFGLGTDDGSLSNDNALFFGHWVGTIPWLWVGAGVSAVAVAVAALKHDAAPRWIGWVSAIVGGITLAFGLSPLQYMSGFFGPVWLIVAALGFALSERTSR